MTVEPRTPHNEQQTAETIAARRLHHLLTHTGEPHIDRTFVAADDDLAHFGQRICEDLRAAGLLVEQPSCDEMLTELIRRWECGLEMVPLWTLPGGELAGWQIERKDGARWTGDTLSDALRAALGSPHPQEGQ